MVGGDHGTPATSPREWPALALLLWALICGVMALLVVLGLVCFLVGALALVMDLGSLDMRLANVTVRTTGEKLWFTGVGAGLALTGSAFWWLRGRGRYWSALILYVLLVALVFMSMWLTGERNLISIGF